MAHLYNASWVYAIIKLGKPMYFFLICAWTESFFQTFHISFDFDSITQTSTTVMTYQRYRTSLLFLLVFPVNIEEALLLSGLWWKNVPAVGEGASEGCSCTTGQKSRKQRRKKRKRKSERSDLLPLPRLHPSLLAPLWLAEILEDLGSAPALT